MKTHSPFPLRHSERPVAQAVLSPRHRRRCRPATRLAATLLLSLLPAVGIAENTLARTMYTSRRANSRGDLIRVLVDEQTSASKDRSISTGKEFGANAIEGTIGNKDSEYTLPRKVDMALPPYNLSASSSYSGEGGTASSESLAASLTAQVMDVLPNNILVIHGERLVTLGEEEVRMILTGLVRQTDVSANNTVSSVQIADARIRYVTTGEVTRGSSPGWLTRVFHTINPF